jgi:hypothetical protein
MEPAPQRASMIRLRPSTYPSSRMPARKASKNGEFSATALDSQAMRNTLSCCAEAQRGSNAPANRVNMNLRRMFIRSPSVAATERNHWDQWAECPDNPSLNSHQEVVAHRKLWLLNAPARRDSPALDGSRLTTTMIAVKASTDGPDLPTRTAKSINRPPQGAYRAGVAVRPVTHCVVDCARRDWPALRAVRPRGVMRSIRSVASVRAAAARVPRLGRFGGSTGSQNGV